MKRVVLFLFFIPVFAQAQWHVNLFGGFSNYSGDLQGKAFTLDQSHPAFGLGAQYDLTNHFSLLSNVNYGQFGADDRYNKPDLAARNLSFQTKVLEWNFMGEYNLFDLSEKRFTPYAFAGVAVYHYNPYAIDTLGHKAFLKPLSTEGEGLAQYPDRKPYSLTQFAIPFGAGIKLRVAYNVVLAYEISVRKTFTDYLDDVSTRYVDQAVLLAAKGPEAVELAYRGNELKNGSPYPADGSIRGGPKHQDWYYFSGIQVSIAINNPHKMYNHGKGIIDCPPKVQ